MAKFVKNPTNPGGGGGPIEIDSTDTPVKVDTLDCFDKYNWSIKYDAATYNNFNTTDRGKMTDMANSFVKDPCLDKYEYYNHYNLHTVRRNGQLELASTAQLSSPGITAILDTIPINPNTQMVRLRRMDGTLHIASMKQVLEGIEPVTLGTPNPGTGSGFIFESCQSKFKFYVTDHLGNTRIVYGAEAICGQPSAKLTLTSMTDYSPYGNAIQRKSFMNLSTRFMTTFHERDSATMMDYRNARFSDAQVGGFLSVDPLAEERPGFSPYNYCSGNPINRVDPTGMLDGDFPPPNLDDGVTLWWDSDGRFRRNEGDQTWTWEDNDGNVTKNVLPYAEVTDVTSDRNHQRWASEAAYQARYSPWMGPDVDAVTLQGEVSASGVIGTGSVAAGGYFGKDLGGFVNTAGGVGLKTPGPSGNISISLLEYKGEANPGKSFSGASLTHSLQLGIATFGYSQSSDSKTPYAPNGQLSYYTFGLGYTGFGWNSSISNTLYGGKRVAR